VALIRAPENVDKTHDTSFEAPFILRLAGHIDMLFFRCFCLKCLVSVYCPAACCFLPSHSTAQGFPIWGTFAPGGTFAYLRGQIQGRNEVRWRPGQEAGLAAPVTN